MLILGGLLQPGLALALALALLVLTPRKLRLALVLMVAGIAGWWLPANQLPLAGFEPPSPGQRDFEVLSTAQNWGKLQRYWIALPDFEGRIGYLVLEREIHLDFGASYRAQLSLRGTAGIERASYVAYLQGDYQLTSQPELWEKLIGQSRDQFSERAQGVSSDSIGLVLGLTIGDRSQISDELTFAMRELSLSHIVAVSGANLAIAMGAAFLLARALGVGRRIRFLVASATALGYATVVGPEPSVLRALFMAHVVLICLALGRNTAALVAIAWTAIILLAVDPFLATDFGFALSVAATSGILLLAKPIQQRLEGRVPKVLALGLAVSLSAQLFTLPILLMLQPGIPSYSVLANLLVMPLLTPITLLGLLSFIMQPLPQATELLSFMASLAAWVIEQLANLLIEFPLTRLSWPDQPLGVVLMAAIALLCYLALRRTGARRGCGWMAMVLTVAGASLAVVENHKTAFPADWLVIACDVGQGDALLVQSDRAVALIDVGPESAPIANCLSQAGVSRIDLLVITHFDFDHVGGIQAVFDCCRVEAVMLPDFQDRREIVNSVNRQLATEPELQIVTAAADMTGRLGQASWTVLAPGAIEKAGGDSNAASIVLLFEAESFRLLALADVPASVQDRVAHRYAARLAPSESSPAILKVSHHGAADQSARLMAILRPQYAIFSAGTGNNYGHPTEAALELAQNSGASIIRTDLMGSSAFHLVNGSLKLG